MPKNLFAKSLTSCAIAQEKVKPKQKSQRLLFFLLDRLLTNVTNSRHVRVFLYIHLLC